MPKTVPQPALTKDDFMRQVQKLATELGERLWTLIVGEQLHACADAAQALMLAFECAKPAPEAKAKHRTPRGAATVETCAPGAWIKTGSTRPSKRASIELKRVPIELIEAAADSEPLFVDPVAAPVVAPPIKEADFVLLKPNEEPMPKPRPRSPRTVTDTRVAVAEEKARVYSEQALENPCRREDCHIATLHPAHEDRYE